MTAPYLSSKVRIAILRRSRFYGESHVDQATAGEQPHAHERGERPHRIFWHATSILTAITGASP